jgi:hypothetical protein
MAKRVLRRLLKAKGAGGIPWMGLDTVYIHSYAGHMRMPSGPHLCYALAARQKARHLSRLYDSHLAPACLSVSQFSILSLLEACGKLKITALAEMGVGKSGRGDAAVGKRTGCVRARSWTRPRRPAPQRDFGIEPRRVALFLILLCNYTDGLSRFVSCPC